MPVIAMTREMGSQGKDIAIGLAERLDVKIVHHNLVEHDVSDATGCEESDVNRFLEGKTQFLDRWRLPGKKVLNYTASEVYELAERGNVIIRGWGSAQLLRPVAHVVCVRVCAPMERRVRTLMDRMEMNDADAARREIEDNDAAHERVFGRVSRSDWRDPLLYDLVINTENVPIADGVKLVTRLCELPPFRESPRSIATLRRLRLETQVRNALAHDATIKRHGASINFRVDPETGRVALSGGVSRPSIKHRATEVIDTLPDVTTVENDIQVVRSI